MLKKIKYPKYPYKLDRRRKLTLHQIASIHKEYHRGYTQKELGERYCISQARISQILQPIAIQKILNRLKYIKYKSSFFNFSKERRVEIRRRKRLLQNKKIRKYYKYRQKVCKERKVI